MPLVRVNERLQCIAIKIPPPMGSNAEPVLGMSCKKVQTTARTEDMSALDLINAIAPTYRVTLNGKTAVRSVNAPFIIERKGQAVQ